MQRVWAGGLHRPVGRGPFCAPWPLVRLLWRCGLLTLRQFSGEGFVFSP